MKNLLENLLWRSRLLMVGAVIASMIMALGMFLMATVEVFYIIRKSGYYASLALNGALSSDARTEFVTSVVKAIDSYLIVAILLLFALGLYELFISAIDPAENSEVGSRLLSVRGIDDLKDRLVKLVLLVLAIEFFQYALQVTYTTPLDLLYLAAGILLIGTAFYLLSKH